MFRQYDITVRICLLDHHQNVSVAFCDMTLGVKFRIRVVKRPQWRRLITFSDGCSLVRRPGRTPDRQVISWMQIDEETKLSHLQIYA